MHPFFTYASPGLDEIIFRALNLAGGNPILDRIMIFSSILSGVYVIFLVAIPLWWRGLRAATFDVLLLLAITIVATEAIKYLVDRPRPCDALANVNTLAGYRCAAEFDPAFPSGHASRAFAVLAGISRIYLGLHWPSDVLGGAAVGIGFAILIEIVSRRVELYQRIRARIVEAIPHLPQRSRGG